MAGASLFLSEAQEVQNYEGCPHLGSKTSGTLGLQQVNIVGLGGLEFSVWGVDQNYLHLQNITHQMGFEAEPSDSSAIWRRLCRNK